MTLMTKAVAKEAERQRGREIDHSRGHRNYLIRDRGREIDLSLDGQIVASWLERSDGEWIEETKD